MAGGVTASDCKAVRRGAPSSLHAHAHHDTRARSGQIPWGNRMSAEILPFCPLFFCRAFLTTTPRPAGCPLFLPPCQPVALDFFTAAEFVAALLPRRKCAVSENAAGGVLSAFLCASGLTRNFRRILSWALPWRGLLDSFFLCLMGFVLFCLIFGSRTSAVRAFGLSREVVLSVFFSTARLPAFFSGNGPPGTPRLGAGLFGDFCGRAWVCGFFLRQKN